MSHGSPASAVSQSCPLDRELHLHDGVVHSVRSWTLEKDLAIRPADAIAVGFDELTNPRGREMRILRWPDPDARRYALEGSDIANGQPAAIRQPDTVAHFPAQKETEFHIDVLGLELQCVGDGNELTQRSPAHHAWHDLYQLTNRAHAIGKRGDPLSRGEKPVGGLLPQYHIVGRQLPGSFNLRNPAFDLPQALCFGLDGLLHLGTAHQEHAAQL